MTYGVKSWILTTLINHHKRQGANLKHIVRIHRYCQLNKFHTYRTEHNPKAQITGRISDPTHWVDVAFDVDETNEQERSIFGVPGEPLTSHLRAIFLIQAFRFELIDPLPGGRPRIRLNLLKWDVVGGDKDDRLFFEDAVELGSRASQDEAADVVKRWYYGLPSQDAANMKKRPNGNGVSAHRPAPESSTSSKGKGKEAANLKTAPSSAKSNHVEKSIAVPRRISLETYLEPYLRPGARKVIPDWLFDITPAQKEELNAIEMFGIEELPSDDPDAESDDQAEFTAKHRGQATATGVVNVASSQDPDHTFSPPPMEPLEPVDPENGAGPSSPLGRPQSSLPVSPTSPAPMPWSPSPSRRLLSRPSFPQPGQPIRPTPTPAGDIDDEQYENDDKEEDKYGENAEDDRDEDEDENVPVKNSLFQSHRREGFDPLGFPSTPTESLAPSEAASAEPPEYESDGGPEDEPGPSVLAPTSTNGHGGAPSWPNLVHSEEEQDPHSQSQRLQPADPPPHTRIKRTLPQPTPTTRSSAKRARRSPKPGDPPTARSRAKQDVLVDASDQSRNKTTDESQSQSQSQSQSLPNGPRIARNVRQDIPTLSTSVPIDEDATHADDELSEQENTSKFPVRRSLSRAGSSHSRVNGSSGRIHVNSPRKDKGKQRSVLEPMAVAGASLRNSRAGTTPAKRNRDSVEQIQKLVDVPKASSAQPNSKRLRPAVHGALVGSKSKEEHIGDRVRIRDYAVQQNHASDVGGSKIHVQTSTKPNQTPDQRVPIDPKGKQKAIPKLGGIKLNLPLDVPYTEVAVNRIIEKAQAKRVQMAAKKRA